MARDTHLVVKKQLFLTNTFYLNKDKVTFLQVIQETMRQTCCQKHENRQCKYVRTHEE